MEQAMSRICLDLLLRVCRMQSERRRTEAEWREYLSVRTSAENTTAADKYSLVTRSSQEAASRSSIMSLVNQSLVIHYRVQADHCI